MALGHWLKDYIGPNSANSGGGTSEVEVIKIATVNGGGASYKRTDDEASDLYSFNGSGTFDDGKTLSEILGGKKAISFAFGFETDTTCMVKGAFVGTLATGKPLADLRVAQESSDYASATQLRVFANVMVSSGGNPNGKPLTVYAICI